MSTRKNLPKARSVLIVRLSLFFAITTLLIFFVQSKKEPAEDSIIPQNTRTPPKIRPEESETTVKSKETNKFAVIPLAAQFEKSRANLTPADAQNLLERLNSEVPDIRIRSSIGASIIEALCRAGFRDEAWNLIAPDFGILRDFQIRSYFSVCQDPKDVEKISDLTDRNERLRAVEGYLSNRTYKQLLTTDFTTLSIDDDFRGALTNQISLNLFHGSALTPSTDDDPKSRNAAVISDAVSLANQGILSAENIFHLISNDKLNDPFEQVKLLDSLNPEIWASQLPSITPRIIDKMLMIDAAKTLDVFLDHPYSDQTGSIENSINKWLSIDNRGATQWQVEHQSSLTPQQSDRVSSGFLMHAISHGEHETAALWLNRISDAGLRGKFEKELSGLKPTISD